MKKLIAVGFALILFSACTEKQRYTQQSPEIETYKKLIDNYKKLKWDDFAVHYADTAKIHNNVTKKNGITIAQRLEENKTNAGLYSWVIEKEEYEMVVTDKEETWVNFWGIWKGTLKTSGKVYDIPFHLTARFIDGKIVEEFGYWNNAEIVTDMLKQPETPTTDTSIPTN